MITKRIKYLCIRLFEKNRGLDFVKAIEASELGLEPYNVNRASPSGNKYLRTVIKTLNISNKDAILDIGCAKGSALRVLSKFPFKQTDGIELSHYLAKIAKHNFKKLNVGKKVKIYHGDICDFNRLMDYNYYYLYNPFPCHIFKKFIAKVEESLKQKLRTVYIIYNNPVCNDYLVNNNFKMIATFPNEWGGGINIYKKEEQT